MSLFGKKKLSLDEILKGIEDLSEEERAKVLAAMQGKTEPSPTPGESEIEPQASEETEESVDEKESPTPSGIEPATESVEESEPEESAVEEAGENPAPEEIDVASEEETTLTEEAPMEAPRVEETEAPAGANYDELISAQNAKISSLESQLSAMQETLEKIVSKQDKQNFGYSPKANFDDDVQTSRRDAILQGYAPRRVDQYK